MSTPLYEGRLVQKARLARLNESVQLAVSEAHRPHIVHEGSGENRDRLRRGEIESLADADPQRSVLVRHGHFVGLRGVFAGLTMVAKLLQLHEQVEEPALGEAHRVGVGSAARENGVVGNGLREEAF